MQSAPVGGNSETTASAPRPAAAAPPLITATGKPACYPQGVVGLIPRFFFFFLVDQGWRNFLKGFCRFCPGTLGENWVHVVSAVVVLFQTECLMTSWGHIKVVSSSLFAEPTDDKHHRHGKVSTDESSGRLGTTQWIVYIHPPSSLVLGSKADCHTSHVIRGRRRPLRVNRRSLTQTCCVCPPHFISPLEWRLVGTWVNMQYVWGICCKLAP